MFTIALPAIHTMSRQALGGNGINFAGPTLGTAWPVANTAMFVPVNISRPALVQRLFSVNGTTVSGNIDMGIYTLDGAKIVSIGSTAQAGTSALQFYNIADTYLSPGQYYMAVALDNNVGKVGRYNITVIRCQQAGVLKATSSFALPASVTFATVTSAFIPSIGMELMGIL